MGMQRVAIAIGGLGGNNAHGAGFLAAAHETQRLRGEARRPRPEAPDGDDRRRRAAHGLLPEVEFISCTSGAMLWVARYLQGTDLRAALRATVQEVDARLGLPDSEWTRDWRGPLLAGVTGIPGVFRPAWQAYLRHWQRRMTARPFAWPTTPRDWYDLLYPAQVLIPAFPDSLFEQIAATFNDRDHGVGVAFNSFNPRSGLEYLHVNELGMQLLAARDPDVDYGRVDGTLLYRDIRPDDVRAALRLFAYGFIDADAEPAGPAIDGAYARSIILNELTFAERIYAVKPLNTRWIGRLPGNQFEVQDMQTERWFETSYREQARLINKISKLTRSTRLVDEAGREYRDVELVPVELEMQRGYFQYFVEELDVFEDAYNRGLATLHDRDHAHRGEDARDDHRKVR